MHIAEINQLLKPLREQLMKEVMNYGICEISTEQYQNVCNSIIRFAKSSQAASYSQELMDSYKKNLDKKCSTGEIGTGIIEGIQRLFRNFDRKCQ